jgi:hypothetical protein
MIELIETNYMSQECNQLRDKLNEVITILNRVGKTEESPVSQPDQATTTLGLRRLKNGRYMFNGRMISQSKALEMGANEL